MPAFFGKHNNAQTEEVKKVKTWLKEARNFPQLADALIPELIIYSTGGNILAFCPAALVNDLSNAIEKRYTEETITANSCAVGNTFKLLEIRFGLLRQPIETTNWLDWYRQEYKNPLVQAYFGNPKTDSEISDAFYNRKSFNELSSKLAIEFNHRRSGNFNPDRPSRCYPPILETHPYLIRDESDRASAIVRVEELPGEPWFSEPLARKRLVGQKAKRDTQQTWYEKIDLEWRSGEVESWVSKFEKYSLDNRPEYYKDISPDEIQEARTLEEIGNSSDGFVSFIYADGNNMGGYIQKIKTPQEYQEFSRDVFQATEESVYRALSQHLAPRQLQNLTKPESKNRNGIWIHPFEIIAIGGDDVLLIVPADRALIIAKTIAEEFENILANKEAYRIENERSAKCHRYLEIAKPSRCRLSMSAGVLTISYNTPIYYAERLANQLLKSSKKMAKKLKKKYQYLGGTIDFLILKSVTAISSNLDSFREEGSTIKTPGKATLKLYAAPFTIHEIGGLIKTAEALKQSKFPRSQLYQIRSLLAQGKNTSILNYRYFRVRLSKEASNLLEMQFEKVWCQPKDSENKGNLAPWMSVVPEDENPTTYETIWRELVDIYPFVDEVKDKQSSEAKVQL